MPVALQTRRGAPGTTSDANEQLASTICGKVNRDMETRQGEGGGGGADATGKWEWAAGDRSSSHCSTGIFIYFLENAANLIVRCL